MSVGQDELELELHSLKADGFRLVGHRPATKCFACGAPARVLNIYKREDGRRRAVTHCPACWRWSS